MTQNPLSPLHSLVWMALCAALTAAGAFVHIPMGPVPISLQTMFVLLAGFLLGPWRGALAILLYVAAGLLGLPVFAGGRSGLAVLFGPTGGYLLGFVTCALLGGLATQRAGADASTRTSYVPGWWRLLLFGALGFASVYALGVPRLAMLMEAGLGKAFSVGMLPFLPGDVVKLAAACLAARSLHKWRLVPR